MRVGVMLVVASTGCRQIVGFDEETPASHDAGIDAEARVFWSTTGRWQFTDPGCRDCVDRSCADAATACAADPSCRAYEACVAACPPGNKGCASECLPRVPSAVLSPETRPLVHCVAAACSVACPSSVVTNAEGNTCGPVFANLDCASCCCKEFAACDNESDCVRQSACARQCMTNGPLDQPCFEACTGRQPDPLTPTANIGACAQGPCQTSCSGRPDWSCLGHVWQPQPSLGPRKLYGAVVLNTFASNPMPLGPGFHVKLCSYIGAVIAQATAGLDPCAMSRDDQVSDDGGKVVLDLSRGSGFSTYFEVTAPPGLDYQKSLFFLAEWTLTHSLHKEFYLDLRNTVLSLPTAGPGRGVVVFRTFDCRQALNLAAGVEVEAEVNSSPAGDRPVYTALGVVPDRGATSTSGEGVGIITNLPAGQVTLYAHRHDTGQLIGRTQIMVQPDAVTVVELVPTP